jgi:hypothetical protein
MIKRPLRCTVCHTIWQERCLLEWGKCPHSDCTGMLRTVPPEPQAQPVQAAPVTPAYPLFDADAQVKA